MIIVDACRIRHPICRVALMTQEHTVKKCIKIDSEASWKMCKYTPNYLPRPSWEPLECCSEKESPSEHYFWGMSSHGEAEKTSRSIPNLEENCFKNQACFSYRFWFTFWLTFWSQKVIPSTSEAYQKLHSQQGRFWCSNVLNCFETCAYLMIHMNDENHAFS